MSLAAILAAQEYFSLRKNDAQGLKLPGVILAGLLPLVAVQHPTYQEFAGIAFGLVLFGSIVFLILVMWSQWPQGTPIESAAVAIMGVLYTGGTLSFWNLLRAFPEEMLNLSDPLSGTLLLIFPIWTTWIGDCLAYLVGSRWGRKKLIVEVSPNKTIVGSLGGLAGSIIGGIGYNHYLLREMTEIHFPLEMILVFSCLVALIGQLGDLSESVMKRQAGIKDSSGLIPGHGGVLDRLDGLFFTIPMTYFIFLLYIQYG